MHGQPGLKANGAQRFVATRTFRSWGSIRTGLRTGVCIGALVAAAELIPRLFHSLSDSFEVRSISPWGSGQSLRFYKSGFQWVCQAESGIATMQSCRHWEICAWVLVLSVGWIPGPWQHGAPFWDIPEIGPRGAQTGKVHQCWSCWASQWVASKLDLAHMRDGEQRGHPKVFSSWGGHALIMSFFLVMRKCFARCSEHSNKIWITCRLPRRWNASHSSQGAEVLN